MRIATMAGLLILPLVFGGCVTGDRVRSIRLGMDQAQITGILGDPDGQKQDGDYIAYQYTNRLISGWGWDRADYGVVFNQGKVIQYGAGTVRQDQNHQMLVIVPIR
jgi:hypothetical protein